MLKKQKSLIKWKDLALFLIFILTGLFLQLISLRQSNDSRYSFFIEFNDANSINVGTPVKMRGINIGSVRYVKLKLNCVLVLVNIKSNNTIIPRDSIIETTQSGLLSDSFIDIVPLRFINNLPHYRPLSSSCDSSTIICNNMYVLGERGLNYDDLLRSTTRISQRFDDPRFFHLFYLFLQGSLDILDNLSIFINNMFDFVRIDK